MPEHKAGVERFPCDALPSISTAKSTLRGTGSASFPGTFFSSLQIPVDLCARSERRRTVCAAGGIPVETPPPPPIFCKYEKQRVGFKRFITPFRFRPAKMLIGPLPAHRNFSQPSKMSGRLRMLRTTGRMEVVRNARQSRQPADRQE